MLIKKKIGNDAALKNPSFAARRNALRRRESRDTRVSSARFTGRLPASHSANPLSASPQREQNFISSETCCWPQLGQYINPHVARDSNGNNREYGNGLRDVPRRASRLVLMTTKV